MINFNYDKFDSFKFIHLDFSNYLFFIFILFDVAIIYNIEQLLFLKDPYNISVLKYSK